jgi:putative ABC transport system permease protein
MFRHYLKTALHNLRRHRLATATHVLGLALGLACFVVTFTFIDSLTHGEPRLPNADRIYVLTQALWIRNASRVLPAQPITPLLAADYIKTDFPQLEVVARAVPAGFLGGGRLAISSGDKSGFVYDAFVDSDFFKIFHFRFLAGDADSAFKTKDGAVITESAALRVFGTRSVLGRHVLFQSKNPGVITGVIADVPQPSHMGDSPQATLRFDILSHLDPAMFGIIGTDWTSPMAFTYVVLPANGSLSLAALRAGLKGFSDRHMERRIGRSTFDAVPVAAVRLPFMNSALSGTGFSITTTLYTLDALVLIVACFNYANLATALALRRTREIALRKIVGAQRHQLVVQCLFEAAIIGVVALLMAVVAALALIPPVNALLTANLQPAAFVQPRMWLFLAGLVFTVTLLGGVYPAWALSRLKPVQGLRASSGRAGAGRYLPRILIGLQFAAAGFLIVMVLIVQGQNRVMQRALIGIAQNPEIVITTSIKDTGLAMSTLLTRLAESPAVASASAADAVPWGGCCWIFIVSHSPDPAAKSVQSAGHQIGPDYFKTVGLKLLAGRTFVQHTADETEFEDWSKRPLNVIIDRELAAELGWREPSAAIGATIYRPTYPPPLTLRIIGVVENGNSRLIDVTGGKSNLYLFMPAQASYAVVRFKPQDVAAAVAHIQATWKALAPAVPLEYRFTDQLFADAYASFTTISTVATGLTVFAFVIALMGLFGMAVQVTNGRLREIGVRKTLGAKPRQILALLLIDFSKPVVIANLIAWPFAYLAARAYLSMFLEREGISPFAFVLSLVATVVIACVVISGQALRAARAEPATVLRYE